VLSETLDKVLPMAISVGFGFDELVSLENVGEHHHELVSIDICFFSSMRAFAGNQTYGLVVEGDLDAVILPSVSEEGSDHVEAWNTLYSEVNRLRILFDVCKQRVGNLSIFCGHVFLSVCRFNRS